MTQRSLNLIAMNRKPHTNFTLVEEFERLNSLGALPPVIEFSIYSEACSPVAGLLAAWKEWLRIAPKSRRSRAARIHSGLLAAIAFGADLTFTLPGRSRQIHENWIGPKVCWWPGGVINSRCVGIVSSRLRRDTEANAPVTQALRLSMTAIDACSERLVASAETSLCEYIEKCGMLFEIPLFRVSATTEQTPSTPWIEQLIQPPSPDVGPALLISPPATSQLRNDSTDTDDHSNILHGIPTRDRVVALLSQRLFVLTLRQNGNWWKILRAGFEDRLWNPGSVRTVVGNGLCADQITAELQSMGAVRWYLDADKDEGCGSTPETQTATAQPLETPPAEVEPFSRLLAEKSLIAELVRPESASEWLAHWTRDPKREWAGESHDAYLTSIVLNDVDHQRTAFGTLERLIREQVIRATPGNTRAVANVVCFSERPLTKLITQRVFRPHRTRWDFEHYGVCIRRRLVQTLGGRPVIYGDESTWASLSEGERPWFQPEQSRSTARTIDWTTESEWRIAADLNLARAQTEDIFIFCATNEEAAQLRSACSWRIVSVESLVAAGRSIAASDA
jgi:hypothetical protein